MELADLAAAQLTRVLDQNERSKYTAYLVVMKSAAVPEPVETVILAEKTSFPEPASLAAIFGGGAGAPGTVLQCIDTNDVYYRFLVELGGQAHAKLTVIHPATPKHIAKYTKQDRLFVRETPKLYQTHVLPYIAEHPASRLQWVQNILQERSEMESLVAVDRDPQAGFYLVPDSKWDRRNLAGLYLLAISKDSAIRSLRDLDGAKHLPLLKGIRRAVDEQVPARFPGITGAQLRCFIHYQPTYYHFHVHIVHIDMVDGIGALVGQAHLLDDVIDNLETFGADYYQRKILSYTLGSGHELRARLA